MKNYWWTSEGKEQRDELIVNAVCAMGALAVIVGIIFAAGWAFGALSMK